MPDQVWIGQRGLGDEPRRCSGQLPTAELKDMTDSPHELPSPTLEVLQLIHGLGSVTPTTTTSGSNDPGFTQMIERAVKLNPKALSITESQRMIDHALSKGLHRARGRDRQKGVTNRETEPTLSRRDRAQLQGGRQREQEAGQRKLSRRRVARVVLVAKMQVRQYCRQEQSGFWCDRCASSYRR